ASPAHDVNKDVVYQLTRGVTVIAPTLTTGGTAAAVPIPTQPSQSTPPPVPSASSARPIRIASLDGDSSRLAGLSQRDAPFVVVKPAENPDLFWDPASGDVISWGDVIAYRVDKGDLPSVIDRIAAIRDLKQVAIRSPQSIKIGPDDGLHRRDSTVQIEVSEVKGRSLVMFNVAGDGKVQMLYPIGSDPIIIPTPNFTFVVRVREPFGADQIIAVTSDQPITTIKDA